MNGEHFRAFLWLRWRLLVNQMKRGGPANAIAAAILGGAALLAAGCLLVGSFVGGLFLPAHVPPLAWLVGWDVAAGLFLFSWALGLLVELQRSEALSPQKFLHLPVSLTSVFLLNYISSLFGLTMLFFLPAVLGLGLALVIVRGPVMLLLFPLLAAFVLMVTALSYQFQSWLAAIMANKRRRRTILALLTIGLILMCQAPNLVNILRPWGKLGQPNARLVRLQQQQQELVKALSAGEITQAEQRKRNDALQAEYMAQTEEEKRQELEKGERIARFVNLALPPGWLPLGAEALAHGNVLPALLGALGMGLIGSLSLWRSYRTLLRLYTGSVGAAPAAVTLPAAPLPARAGKPGVSLLEWRLPWVSEQASAIALAGFRGLTRAPEVKMLLLTPAILIVVFGSMLFTPGVDVPAEVRPLLGFGIMGIVLFTMLQLVGNQFGFDRSGFRAFVLSPASRRDVLLGKNLAVAPLALGMALLLLVALQIVLPMRLDHFLACLPQMASMYLLFCLPANCMSILAPMAVASGSLKQSSANLGRIMLQFGFALLLPPLLLPALLPQGVEVALEALDWVSGLPVCLALSVLELAVLVLVYRLALTWQGRLLQAREQRVLAVVAARAE